MIFKEIDREKKKVAWNVPELSKYNKSGGVRITIPRHAAAPQPLCGRGDAGHKSPWKGGGNLSSTTASILQGTPEAATKGSSFMACLANGEVSSW